MSALWQDLRHAVRALGRRPLFTAAAALTLASGSAPTRRSSMSSTRSCSASRLFPGEDPLGRRHLGIGWKDGETAEIIGVAGDVKYGRMDEPVEPDLYIPFAQSSDTPVTLVFRTRSAPLSMVSEVRQAVFRLDRDVPVFDVQTMEHE